MAQIFGWNIDAIPGINVGQAVKQIFDPGGDYDVLDNASFNGGARDSNGTPVGLGKTQGTTKPGFDSTGRYVGSNKPTVTSGHDNLSEGEQSAEGGYGGAGGANSAESRAARAFYDAGISNIDSLIASLPAREASALSSLLHSYLQTKSRQDVEFGDYKDDYDKNLDRITRDDARKKTQIDTNVRNDMSNLTRLLSTRGAGSSSSRDVVSREVARKGTADRADAAQITADNTDEVNTNWNRYDREWNQRRADTDTDYQNNQKDVQSQFAQQGIEARQKRLELDTNRAAAMGGDSGAIARASSTAGEINALQQKINEFAARAAGRTITNKDLTMQDSTQKAFNDPGNTSTAQTGQGPQDDSTAFYDASVAKPKTEDELLKELFGV